MAQTKPQIRKEQPIWPWILAAGIGLSFYGLFNLVHYVEHMPLPRIHG